MKRISVNKRQKILNLRLTGRSIPEIAASVGVGVTTVQRYVKNIRVPEVHRNRLRERQGGAKARAAGLRANVYEEADSVLGALSKRDSLMVLVGLYWGEGTKRDFSIINSDPYLIQTFIRCLYELGISKERLSYSLRVHKNVSVTKARNFWAATAGLGKNRPVLIERIEGKKKGKLPHGMCRIRVKSGIRERLFLQSLISLIGKDSAKKVVSA